MARIVLVLVCGVLVFVLVSKFAPHFLETYLPAAAGLLSPETSTDETDSSKAALEKKKAAASKPKSGTRARSSAAASEAPAATGFGNAPTPSPVTGASQATEVAGGPRHIARVTAENATLYLTNTSGGPVVGRLTKGSVVETVFVVSSAGQNWTFVNASDRQIAGFLRSETLAKTKTADQSSR